MNSKSELKRKATLDPLWAAQRIAELEAEAEEVRLLERVELTALEKNTTLMRHYRQALVDIRKRIDEVLEP